MLLALWKHGGGEEGGDMEGDRQGLHPYLTGLAMHQPPSAIKD